MWSRVRVGQHAAEACGCPLGRETIPLPTVLTELQEYEIFSTRIDLLNQNSLRVYFYVIIVSDSIVFLNIHKINVHVLIDVYLLVHCMCFKKVAYWSFWFCGLVIYFLFIPEGPISL